jgi:hypothetical protein
LRTLLGLDEHTARMPGYGVIHADLARQLSRDWADAEWRLALQDHSGALSTVLVTLQRPTGWATVPVNPDGTPRHPGADHPATGHPAGSPTPPRELVVIHATDADLASLPLADHPSWAAFLTDARRQTTFWRRDAVRRATAGGLLADLLADPAARFPSAAQRRWVSERNQTCTFRSCGADAVHSDIDHTRPRQGSGPTLTWNLGPACAHDNALKEQPGWWVEQPRPGHFRWYSNTGHSYPSKRTGPVPDHLDPRRFDVTSSTEPVEYAGHGPAWIDEPYPADRERPPPRRPSPHDDDPPPF